MPSCAVLAKGDSDIRMSASERIYKSLPVFSTNGAKLSNIAPTPAHYRSEHAHGNRFHPGPDYLEVIIFVDCRCNPREVTIRNAGNQYLDMIPFVFGRHGIEWEFRR